MPIATNLTLFVLLLELEPTSFKQHFYEVILNVIKLYVRSRFFGGGKMSENGVGLGRRAAGRNERSWSLHKI